MGFSTTYATGLGIRFKFSDLLRIFKDPVKIIHFFADFEGECFYIQDANDEYTDALRVILYNIDIDEDDKISIASDDIRKRTYTGEIKEEDNVKAIEPEFLLETHYAASIMDDVSKAEDIASLRWLIRSLNKKRLLQETIIVSEHSINEGTRWGYTRYGTNAEICDLDIADITQQKQDVVDSFMEMGFPADDIHVCIITSVDGS